MFKLEVSSRIDYSDTDKYYEIERKLIAAIRKGRLPTQVWDETTSFFVVETAETSFQFARRLIAEAGLRSVDLLLVKNTMGPDAWAWGRFKNWATLKRLLPGVQLIVPPPPFPTRFVKKL